MGASSVDVDLNWRPMAKAKGCCTDFKDAKTILLMVKARTIQLHKIEGMKVVLYSREIVFRERPQGDTQQHFKMRNRLFFTVVHFLET